MNLDDSVCVLEDYNEERDWKEVEQAVINFVDGKVGEIKFGMNPLFQMFGIWDTNEIKKLLLANGYVLGGKPINELSTKVLRRNDKFIALINYMSDQKRSFVTAFCIEKDESLRLIYKEVLDKTGIDLKQN